MGPAHLPQQRWKIELAGEVHMPGEVMLHHVVLQRRVVCATIEVPSRDVEMHIGVARAQGAEDLERVERAFLRRHAARQQEVNSIVRQGAFDPRVGRVDRIRDAERLPVCLPPQEVGDLPRDRKHDVSGSHALRLDEILVQKSVQDPGRCAAYLLVGVKRQNLPLVAILEDVPSRVVTMHDMGAEAST